MKITKPLLTAAETLKYPSAQFNKTNISVEDKDALQLGILLHANFQKQHQQRNYLGWPARTIHDKLPPIVRFTPRRVAEHSVYMC